MQAPKFNLGLVFKGIALVGLLALIYWKYGYTPSMTIETIEMYDDHGTKHTISSGQPAIISFYQTWCSDCVRETPVLHEFAQKNGINLYLISDESADKIAKFKARFEGNLPFYHSQKPLSEVGIKKYPTVYFFDKNGKLLFKRLEVVEPKDLEDYLSKI